MMKQARGVGASRADFLSWRTEVSYVVVERVSDSLPSPQTNHTQDKHFLEANHSDKPRHSPSRRGLSFSIAVLPLDTAL
jgi:hypothetical protein